MGLLTQGLVTAMTDIPQFLCNLPLPDYAAIVANDAAWSATLPFLDSLAFTVSHWCMMNPADQSAVAAFMRSHGISLEITIPGIKHWAPTAAEALVVTQGPLRHINAAMPISAINIDEALGAAIDSTIGQTVAWAAQQVATGIVAPLRAIYPNARWSITEPVPHVTTAVLEEYIEALADNGFVPDLVVIDPNWPRKDFLWSDVATFAIWCAARSQAWGLDYWDATTGDTWLDGLIAQGEACSVAGILPTQIRVTSWMGKPASNAKFLSSVAIFHARFVGS